MSGLRTMGLAFLVLGMALTVVAVAEDVTVSTYYPSPKGVYQQLSTTNQTLLATQGGNVGIGTNAPAFKLDVNGTCNITGATTLNALTATQGTFNNGLTVTAGNTQVGTLSAGATTITGTTQMNGNATVTGNAVVTGTVRVGGGGPAAGEALVSTDAAGNATWGYPYAVYAP